MAKAEAFTRNFLGRYYGGNVNFRGMMGLRSASAVIDVLWRCQAVSVTDRCIRLGIEDQVEQVIRDVLPAVNVRHGEK